MGPAGARQAGRRRRLRGPAGRPRRGRAPRRRRPSARATRPARGRGRARPGRASRSSHRWRARRPRPGRAPTTTGSPTTSARRPRSSVGRRAGADVTGRVIASTRQPRPGRQRSAGRPARVGRPTTSSGGGSSPSCPARYREAHVAGFSRHLSTGDARALGVDLELPVLRADGTELACRFLIESTRPPAVGSSTWRGSPRSARRGARR
jgi:hypothetical protein